MANYFINGINSSFPPGSIISYLGATDPDGWIIADGVARTNSSIYNNLVTMGIGTRTGGNYTPPNYRGAFLRGTGTSNVNTAYSGPALNASQTDDNKSHNHTITDPGHRHVMGGSASTSGNLGSRSMNAGSSSNTYKATTGITINNSGNNENRPFNIGVNWIIKL
jgi:hypothetical protein